MKRLWSWLLEETGLSRPGILVTGSVMASAIVAIAIAAGGGDPPPPGTANIWVDTTPGTCVDGAARAYVDAESCSPDGANDTCEAGDTVGWRGGSYGSVTINGSNGRSGDHCTFQVPDGQTVTMTSFVNGLWNDFPAPNGASWIEFKGNAPCRYPSTSCSIVTNEFDADSNNNTIYDGWDIDGNLNDDQLFHVEDVGNLTLRNSQVHSVLNANGMSIITGNGPLVLEDSDFYEAMDSTGGAVHTECAWTALNNVTIRRTHWWSCGVMNIFLTGNANASNWLVENNVFERPLGPNHNGFAFRGGGEPSPNPDGFIMRYNTFYTGVQMSNAENPATANGFQVYGNFFLTQPPCGITNGTYSYNVTPTGTGNCGGTGAQSFSRASIDAGFTDPEEAIGFSGPIASPPGNYTLTSTSPLRNIGNVSLFPTVDFLSLARFDGSAPDVGAFEYQE